MKATEKTMAIAYKVMLAQVNLSNAALAVGPNTLGVGPMTVQTFDEFCFSCGQQTEECMQNYIANCVTVTEQIAHNLYARL